MKEDLETTSKYPWSFKVQDNLYAHFTNQEAQMLFKLYWLHSYEDIEHLAYQILKKGDKQLRGDSIEVHLMCSILGFLALHRPLNDFSLFSVNKLLNAAKSDPEDYMYAMFTETLSDEDKAEILRTPLDDIFDEIGEYYPEDYSYQKYRLFSALPADIRQNVARRTHQLFCFGCNANDCDIIYTDEAGELISSKNQETALDDIIQVMMDMPT